MPEGSRYQAARITAVLDGRYQLRREIARGGHGVVFEAEHLVTRAHAAFKTLSGAAPDNPAAQARLIREARVIGAVKHPHVISVLDAGVCSKFGPYAVLEMIEGRPLDGILLTRQTLPVAQTIALALQLCDALSAVHHHGIVHRDVKPGNLLIAHGPSGDRLLLIDFGIAKVSHEEETATQKITRLGELLGTVEYMAPEQIKDDGPIDPRSDVYAAGVVLYECLTGEVPYMGSPTAVIASMLAATPIGSIRALRSDVPPALEAAIRRALELDPAKRFATIRELAHACYAALTGPLPRLELLAMSRAGVVAAKPAEPAPLPPVESRRQFVRAPYVTPLRVLVGGRAVDGRTEDISEGGVLMVTESGFGDGEQVTVRLPLPLSGRVVELAAKTRWIRSRRNQQAIGAEFSVVPDDVRTEIRGYVALMTGTRANPPRTV